MGKELNCMNCCIGDFKDSLCDCDNGICKEYKKVGRAEDFENEVLNRTKRKKGRWINAYPDTEPNPMFMYGICSICGFEQSISDKLNFCPNCGAKMEHNVMR